MKTQIMGILNTTPDSFSDGGKYISIDDAVARAEQMLAEGADIIDLGGESTRPGSEFVSTEEEIQRTVPVIKAIRSSLGNAFSISIDTYKAEVAKQALAAGASIVNSMGGFQFDKQLAAIVTEYNCQICIYHIKGTPKTMQQGEITYDDVVTEVANFFTEQITIGENTGISKDKFILDPGIGFGKNTQHNIDLIKRLDEFKTFDLPILIGVSRKSHLAIILKDELQLSELPTTDQRLSAALAETGIAIQNGATIVRTHDVLETKKYITILEKLL